MRMDGTWTPHPHEIDCSQSHQTPLVILHAGPDMTSCRLAIAVLLLTAPLHAAAPFVSRRPILTFEQHVRPILRAHCLECHGESGKPKGRLDLRLRRLIATGGRN